MEPDELRALLQLRALPGLDDLTLSRLLRRAGTARAALWAPASLLGAPAAAARGTQRVEGWVDRALETIERLGIAVWTPAGPGYPAVLEQLYDPPPVVFARGRRELLDPPAVAVVGTRRPTVYGLEAARALAGGLARAGVVVVSGLARGIDGAAHEAALDGAAAGGGTIGVLGCGIDVAYPRRHEALCERVAAEGLLLSEFLPGEPARPYNFPRRNRIIAALARGVLVVEAAAKSGALITVEHAVDLGRDVFAVPGPIGRATSEGTNRLVQSGAMLVTSVSDILEELNLPAPAHIELPLEPPEPTGLPRDRLTLWRALEEEPRHVDDLAAACALGVRDALVGLLDLELRGHARQLPGKRFVRA